MKVYEAIARAFAEETGLVFSLMGDGNMLWQAALEAAGAVTIVNVRDEGAGVQMADGYFRASGRTGVCSVTSGPGLTQTATAMLAASRHGSALVVFAGDTPASGKCNGGMQDLDQQRFAEACGAWFHPVRTPATALEDVQRAFFIARSRSAPVVLNAPIDVQEAEYPRPYDYTPSARLTARPALAVPDEASLDQAAALIKSARRPVIIAGGGCSGARAELSALAARIGAPIATTVHAKGWFDADPFCLDIAGGFSSAPTESILGTADLIIAIGATLSSHTRADGTLFPQAEILQIDAAPFTILSRQQPVAGYVQGDARLAVAAISARLDGRQSQGLRTAEVAALIGEDPRRAEIETQKFAIRDGGADPRALMLALDALLPDDCAVVIGAGHFWSFPARFLSGGRNRRFFYSYDFGSISHGLPLALGVAFAEGRPIALIEGDASLIMNLQELDTLARYRLPILTIIMNDQALGAEYHKLCAAGLPLEGAAVATPDLAAIAAGFGIDGRQLRSPEKLADHVPANGGWNGPILIDAHISRDVPSRYYAKKFYAASDSRERSTNP